MGQDSTKFIPLICDLMEINFQFLQTLYPLLLLGDSGGLGQCLPTRHYRQINARQLAYLMAQDQERPCRVLKGS